MCTYLDLFGSYGCLGLLLELLLLLYRGGWPSGLRGADDGSRAVHGLHIYSTQIRRQSQYLGKRLLVNTTT